MPALLSLSRFVFALVLASLVHVADAQAPRPLYRDPVFDGAADAAVVFNKQRGRWEMFYTNRRATQRLDDPKDVSWVHGTRIGIASTQDGNTWHREGDAEFPAECTGGTPERSTHWAPEIIEHEGRYHLWLTVVPGIHSRWTGRRFLQHLTSTDLRRWQCADQLELGSQRIIDASVVRLDDGRWRLWFKDEAQGSRLFAAESADLKQWKVQGPITAGAAEGPKVFRFKGQWWLVADLWRGLLVMRSADAAQWQEQPTRLLAEPGRHPTDLAKGQHPDVVVIGERAFIFYFVHQGNEAAASGDDRYHQRSVIQVAELTLNDGWLAVERDAPPPDLRHLFGAKP
ncbi:family 43 glycosylhydrolase [Roseateles microcysteis]|uniref:family 43 glycosylhydrolase n=1 Tax=Roseateles microcysteis TaxID=3119057 RepID=UPI002FE65CFD